MGLLQVYTGLTEIRIWLKSLTMGQNVSSNIPEGPHYSETYYSNSVGQIYLPPTSSYLRLYIYVFTSDSRTIKSKIH